MHGPLSVHKIYPAYSTAQNGSFWGNTLYRTEYEIQVEFDLYRIGATNVRILHKCQDVEISEETVEV